jgi:beta-lactamase regulating signal transducer with metallopeptidase domain
MWQPLLDGTAAIAERLLTGSLQGGAAAVLVWAFCRWVPRVPASWQAWAWWLVALKLVLALVPLPAVPLPLLPESESGPAVTGTSTPQPQLAGSTTAPALPIAAPSSRRINWKQLLVTVWLGGVAVHLLVLARTGARLGRIRRRASPLSGADRALVSELAAIVGLRKLPRVVTSDEIWAPQVVGLRAPVVLVPVEAAERLTSSEWRMAIAHELVHVRRRDLLLGCVPALAERLYFFNPLARLAVREYAMAREAACDAAVVQALDVPVHTYGSLLIRFGVSRGASALVASSASGSASCLRRRLDMLQQVSSKTTPRALTACVAVAALLTLVPVEIVARASQAPALPPLPPLPPAQVAQPAPPAPAPPRSPRPVTPPAPPAQAAPAAPLAPPPPAPPAPPRSDEVVLRLKSPTTESEAVDTALRVLETQLAQVDAQAAAGTRLAKGNTDELEQARRKLQELVRIVQEQARAGQTVQERASLLARQMAELGRQREALIRQQQDLQKQMVEMNESIERMKTELRNAQGAAGKGR